MGKIRFFICALCIMLIGSVGCAVDAPMSAGNTPAIEPKVGTSTVSINMEVVTPAPMATSRGDKLDASSPSTFRKNSGRPVLIEFFRFT